MQFIQDRLLCRHFQLMQIIIQAKQFVCTSSNVGTGNTSPVHKSYTMPKLPSTLSSPFHGLCLAKQDIRTRSKY